MSRTRSSSGGSNGVVITYTSLFLLLLTFFILLNSMGRVEESRLQAVYRSLQASFGLHPRQTSGPGLLAPVNPVEQDYAYLRGLAGQEDLGREIIMLRSGSLHTVVMSQGMLFGGSGEELTPQAQEFLAKVAEILKERNYPLSIAGHVEAQSLEQAPGQDEFTLSGRRALKVLRLLVEKGVDPSRLAALGLGARRPLLPASDPRHQRFNSRVDLVLDARDQSSDLLPADQTRPQSQFRGFLFDLDPERPQPEGRGE
ncbi:MAG: OmpA family protein [Pseudomonadota bacterium]